MHALALLAEAMAPARHPWWIISSAALVLHGRDPGDVGDIDVLFDPRDAESLLGSLGLPVAPGRGTNLFRSTVFAAWNCAGVAVELFAGFELCEEGVWTPILPASRIPVEVEGRVLYVPDQAELRAMFLRFGRPKDLARATMLSPSGPSPSR